MRHLWVIEEDYGVSGWALLVVKGAFTLKTEASQVLKELRSEADPKYDGPYRLAKYVRAAKK